MSDVSPPTAPFFVSLGKEVAHPDLLEVSAWVGEHHQRPPAAKELESLAFGETFAFDRLLALINSGTPAGQAVIRLIEEEREELRRSLWLGLNPGV